MIAVRVLRDGRVVRETVLSSMPATIGRGPECDLVLFDDSVSRAHARIEAGDGGGRTEPTFSMPGHSNPGVPTTGGSSRSTGPP